MDKFPKIETIEATLFAERLDELDGLAELSKRLEDACPEFRRAMNGTATAIAQGARVGQRALEIALAVVLARMIQTGVTAERARAECEQLQDAMNPRQLTEGRQPPCGKDSCENIT